MCNNVFQLGLANGRFSSEPAYALAFLDHLSHLTDQENTRHVFQRLLEDLPTEHAEEVWRLFHSFECTYGTLQVRSEILVGGWKW